MKKDKVELIYGIFQVVIGILGIISYLILLIEREKFLKWTVAFILCIIFLIYGIKRIINYVREK